MATSPSPNSSPSADPPVSATAPPPETMSPPPAPLTSTLSPSPAPLTSTLSPSPAPLTSTLSPPPAPLTSTLSPPPAPLTSSSQHNASSPTATPTTPSQTPPSTNLTASPPESSPPPPPAPSSNPPESSPPPPPPPPPPSPNPSSSSPTPAIPSPPSTSPPPPLDLPARSPPPLLPNPPPSPPISPSPKTPASAPATPSEPSKNTPPSPKAPASSPATASEPSKNTPPPPSQPTEKSPPPSPSPSPSPSFKPPKISPPPKESKPRQSPPLPEPTEISPPPSPTPIVTPPPASPDSPPPSTIRHKLSPPSPVKRLSPPPPSLVPPSSPSTPPPSQGPIPPSGNLTTNTFGTPLNSNSTDNASIGTGGTVAIGLVLGLILLSLIGTAIWCVRKRKRKFTGLNGDHAKLTSLCSSPKSDSALIKMQTSGAHNGSRTGNDFVYSPMKHGGLGNSRSWFTYQELVNATNGFSMQNLLGEGGFGSVYKGYLFGGREVAVKQLKIGGGQGEREFKAEVDIISRVHHRHLVSLVGYCISENQRLLVYDYVPNNNLYFHLHGEGRPVMEWATRVKAAAGAARGIAYLHEDCHPRIIHRDIKSSNILLDNSFEARVSDFGLAKLAMEANTHITTRVMGTFGYMAPEYASSGKLTEKSDVYSFGVVLLELITGRKPVDTSQPLGDESLVEWARPLLNHALDNEDFKALADPRLENNYVGSEMFRIIEAAAACVRHSAAKRPRMAQVVRAFDVMAASDLTNGMKVGERKIFNSAQQSTEIRLFRRMTFGSQDYSTNSFRQNSWNS